MPPKTTKDPTLALLEKILLILAIQAASDKSVSEGARLLKIAGLDNVTIAKILGTTAASVSTLTTGVRALSDRMRRPRARNPRKARR